MAKLQEYITSVIKSSNFLWVRMAAVKFNKIKLSLSAKLWTSALVSVFLMLGVGGFVWYSMSTATNSSEWVMKVIVPSVAVTKNISKQVESFEKFYLLALTNRNNSDKFEDAVTNADRAFDRLFGAFEMFEQTKNDETAELRKVATAQWKEFSAGASEFRDALAEKKFEKAEKGLNDFIIP